MESRSITFYAALVLGAAAAFGAPVAVTPVSASVRAGATKQFTATLTAVTGPAVWSVNGTAGGDAINGTVSDTGLYTAPAANPGAILVRATVGTAFAEAAVTWLNPAPQISSLTPAAGNIGTFTITLNGTGFLPSSVVSVGGNTAPSTYVSPTQIYVTLTVSTPSTLTFVVANPDPGAAKSNSRNFNVQAPVQMSVSPDSLEIRGNAVRKFTAAVSNAVDTTVLWSVNGVVGGNATVGTIAADGTYTAPGILPVDNHVQILATSHQDPTVTATSALLLLNPVPAIQAVAPNSLVLGSQSIKITGTGFVPGSQVKMGKTALTTQYVSTTQLTATASIAPVPGGLITFTVANPDPGAVNSAVSIASIQGPANPKASYLAAARFLEQASFGPDAATIAQVQQVGLDGWITEQMALPATHYAASNSSSNSLEKQQSEFFVNATSAPDQLRQRVAFALGQIFVVSGLKTAYPRQMVPYQNMLIDDAFVSYSKLLRDVTLSPTMGVYLDMVNNDKGDPKAGTAPNENYGREVMQLFTLGTVVLNQDGSTQTDSAGNPVPTYTPAVISDMARALTGWTYPGPLISKGHNKEDYSGPMIPVDTNHDTGLKLIVGGKQLPAGQTASQDLDAVINALATHTNVAPFISLRLIQHLVAGNPSPAYVARISKVFTSTQGDLSQVVRAILLDPEPRQNDDPAAAPQITGGHLREPVLFLTSMMRNLSAKVITQNPVESLGSDMGQEIFYAPSVFNYYSPLYRLGNGINAPEYQLMSSATALVRANVVQNMVTSKLNGDAKFNLDAFTQLAGSPSALVDAVNNAFLYGRLPAALKADIVKAISATTDKTQRVDNAIYLVVTSSLYQVEH